MSRKLYRITTTINHPDNMAGFYKDDKDVYDFFKRNIGDEENIMRIAGMSLLPEGVEWPVNPNGEKMVLILNIPTNFLNDKLAYNYPKIR